MRSYYLTFEAMIVTFCLSFAICPLVWGQQRLDPVIITATRIPTKFSLLARNVSVIDTIDIKNSFAYSVEDLLKYVLSADIRQRGPYGVQADPSIRASTFSQVLILINGARVNDPQTAHHNFDVGLTLESIERIEILHGHGSSLYGPDAFGGVINIITKRPQKRNGYMGISYGGHNTSIISGGISGKRGILGSSVSLEKKKSDGYRFDTDFDITTFSSNSTLDLPDLGMLEFLLGYTDKEFGANDFYASYPSKEWTDTVFMSMGTELQVKTMDQLSLQPKIYYRRHKDKYLLDITKPNWYVNHHTTHVYGIECQSRVPLGSLGNLVLGGEGLGEKIESTRLGDHAVFRSAAHAEYESLFADRLILSTGIRADYHSIHRLEWSPSISIGWNIIPPDPPLQKGGNSSSLKLRSSVGKAFRVPSFTELYYEDPANLGNENLKPENAWSYELGADYYNPKNLLYFGITAFRRDEKNLIDWIKKDVTSQKWRAENIARVQARGIETTLKMNFTKSFSALANYTLMELHAREEEDYISKYALNYLRHQFGTKVSHILPYRIQTSMAVTYKERVKEKGYVLLDMRVSKGFSRGEVYIQGTNILSTEYEEIKGIPMPGRWVQVGAMIF